jgi:hypothetical protein
MAGDRRGALFLSLQSFGVITSLRNSAKDIVTSFGIMSDLFLKYEKEIVVDKSLLLGYTVPTFVFNLGPVIDTSIAGPILLFDIKI